MANKSELAEGALSTLMSTWGDKKWFQTAVIIWLFLIPALSILSPIISTYVNKSQAHDVVVSTINERDVRKEKDHRVMFEKSRHIYALAKKEMQESLKPIDAEYAFLIEYHNGAENIMTGVQFCKFDITLEVGEDVNSKVRLEKFHNENIAKYDILLSEDLAKNNLLFFTYDQFKSTDPYLALQLDYLNAKSFALINLLNDQNKVFGTLIFISVNEHMDSREIYSATRKIELLFNTKEENKENTI